MPTSVLFDLEATGLLRSNSKIHCIVLKDLESDEFFVYDDHKEPIDKGIEHLLAARKIVGHNVVGYDLELLTEIYPWFHIHEDCVVWDTLILSRLYYPNLKDRDFSKEPTGLPIGKYGSHSLEAWGHRLGVLKGNYGKQEQAWETYTPEMLDYCKNDCRVTQELWNVMKRRIVEYADE